MRNLIKAIPTREDYLAMDEGQRDLLLLALGGLVGAAISPRVDIEYHPAEKVAILASTQPYVLDFICEFDLAIDYNP